MNIVEVKLLSYTFRFRKLSWREEFNIKFEPKENRLRTVLAHALVDVSGLKINTLEDARRVLKEVPSSIIERVFIIYKGSMPDSKMFSTLGLYCAPEPKKFAKKIMEAEEEREQIMDKVEQQMAAKFGRKEMEEARALERQMLKNSGGAGLTPASPDPEEKK